MPHHPAAYSGPPFYQINGHWQTIWPALFRKVSLSYARRERIETSDGDFLDLDWAELPGTDRLVILSHGLESSADRNYVRGMAQAFFRARWSVLAWNCRSCSGELNRTRKLYHHGDIEDLSTVIDHALRQKDYATVLLIGFSMGGAMTLKYLGVQGSSVPQLVRGGIGFSVPTDLQAGAEVLDDPGNRFYKRRFFRKLKAKLLAKEAQFPGMIDRSLFDQVRTWRDFDDWFSAPVAGYTSARDFYRQSSCRHFMAGTAVPVLLVNALNDPILPPACHPVDLAGRYDLIHLETPRQGGHVGFQDRRGHFWSEQRALAFAKNALSVAH